MVGVQKYKMIKAYVDIAEKISSRVGDDGAGKGSRMIKMKSK
jgi:hypothetical protein